MIEGGHGDVHESGDDNRDGPDPRVRVVVERFPQGQQAVPEMKTLN